MLPKRQNNEDLAENEMVKRYFMSRAVRNEQPGTSTAPVPQIRGPLELLEIELRESSLNVQEIGRIISDGMIEKTLNDQMLNDFSRRIAKNFHSVSQINIFDLADDLNKGVIDSRLVVIGNAFLWNLLKASMSSVRDKFDHYHFKMSASLHNAVNGIKVEFSSTRVRAGQHVISEDSVFRKIDLLDVYNSVVFRKTGDLQAKTKQFVKAYVVQATQPKCAIWHYSLRQSGNSHKKWLQNIPAHVVSALLDFLLSLSGLGLAELDQSFEELDGNSPFFESLGEDDELREISFENLKTTRDSMISKFRSCVTDALNDVREMPYNTSSRELMPPPRGKRINMTNIVTWRHYESLIRKCDVDPTEENLSAKHNMDIRLMFVYQRKYPGDEEEGDADVEIDK